MPIYEYQCEGCGHQFDIIQKISDEKLTLCEECNQHKLRKLVTSAGFKLKGTGWYETDFKTGKKKNISSNESSKSDKSTETSKTNSKKASKQDKIKD